MFYKNKARKNIGKLYMTKSRKNVRVKLNRHNKTLRGGDDTVEKSPKPSHNIPSTLPNSFDDVKQKHTSPVKFNSNEIKALDEDREFLKKILQFTHTSDQQFQNFIEDPKNRNKYDIFTFLKANLVAYLTGKRFVREQVNTLRSYIETDDFDSVMQTHIKEDEDFF